MAAKHCMVWCIAEFNLVCESIWHYVFKLNNSVQRDLPFFY